MTATNINIWGIYVLDIFYRSRVTQDYYVTIMLLLEHKWSEGDIFPRHNSTRHHFNPGLIHVPNLDVKSFTVFIVCSGIDEQTDQMITTPLCIICRGIKIEHELNAFVCGLTHKCTIFTNIQEQMKQGKGYARKKSSDLLEWASY